MISKGFSNITIEDIRNRVTDFDILSYYLNIKNIPCLINSPLRQDNNPSFGFNSKDGVVVCFKDFASRESGDTFNLLCKLWNTDLSGVINRIWEDLPKISPIGNENIRLYTKRNSIHKNVESELKCKIREWEKHDIEYWESYGISVEWLKYADVYPISHKIIIKDDKEYIIPADKHAYAYVERKEGKITLKIYQPYNKQFKWSNKHDSSVISLWTKIPDKGDILCICASLKDALCLWANTGVPAVSVQGEGYSMSETAVNVLKERYKNIFIIFDNDKAGLIDSAKLAEQTGFKNIILPSLSEYGNPKDISDIYHEMKDKNKFKQLFKNLLTD